MPWFKVDDKLHDHPKARQAGAGAMGLWSLAGSWCADNLTDGFVPAAVAARWDRQYKTLAKRLVDARFWSPTSRNGEPGWQFHDWHEYQPTAEKVKAERAAAAERQKRARDAARQRREGRLFAVTDPEHDDESRRDSHTTNGVSHSPPDPTRPDPTHRGGTPSATTTARPSAFCPRHPNGTDDPCGACGIARRAHLAWQPPTPMPPHISELRAKGVIR